MSDLEKVLKIAEEIEAERISAIEDVLVAFMQKKSSFALENLNPWLLNNCGVKYFISDFASPIVPKDLEQAAKNLGFDISFSKNKKDFSIYVPKKTDSNSKETYATKLLSNYDDAFQKETERITNLVEKYYDDLMSKISNKDVRVKKNSSSWELYAMLEKYDSNLSFRSKFYNLMESKGFKNTQLLNDGCSFNIPIEED